MPVAAAFEDFQSKPVHAQAPPPESLPGFDAGYAAGRSDTAAGQAELSAELVRAIEESAFGFAEARQSILSGLAPLFDALTRQLLPQIARAEFQNQICTTLLAAATTDASQPVRLGLHPGQVSVVASVLEALDLRDITLHADPEVSLHCAFIARGPVETVLDVDRLISQLTEVLQSFSHTLEELKDHG